MQVSFCSSIAHSSPTDLAVAPISGSMHRERARAWQPKDSGPVNRRVPSCGLGAGFCPVDISHLGSSTRSYSPLLTMCYPPRRWLLPNSFEHTALPPPSPRVRTGGYRALGISGSNRDSRDRRYCASCISPVHVCFCPCPTSANPTSTSHLAGE